MIKLNKDLKIGIGILCVLFGVPLLYMLVVDGVVITLQVLGSVLVIVGIACTVAYYIAKGIEN